MGYPLLTMLFHPSYLMFLSTLIFSIILGVSSNSLFLAWIGIEINLISFIPLALFKRKHSVESVLKYFLIQRIASIIIIITLNWNVHYPYLTPLALFFILIIKIGVPPLHQWLAPVAEGLSWPIFYILITIQKLIPFALIISITFVHNIETLTRASAVAAALVGSVGGLSQLSLRKIITYSSISHMRWLLLASLLSLINWAVYFFFYWMIIIPLISIFHNNQIRSLRDMFINNKLTTGIVAALNLLSLGGLPPFAGFIPKLLVIQTAARRAYSILLAPLLLATFISLFFYARLISTIVLTNTAANNPFKQPHTLTTTSTLLNVAALLGPTILFTVILNFKLLKLRAFKALNKDTLKFMDFKLI